MTPPTSPPSPTLPALLALALLALALALLTPGCQPLPHLSHPTPHPTPHARLHTPPPPTPPSPPPNPAPHNLSIYAIQIHLDQANFAPGAIDGLWGPKTERAFRAWQRAHHLPETGRLPDALATPLATPHALFTRHIVTKADYAALTTPAHSWTEKSRRKYLGHTSLPEAIAEHYHLSRPALRRLNPTTPWPAPPIGTPLRVPALHPSPIPTPHHLEIRVREKTLRACTPTGLPLAQFPCSIAANPAKQHVGASLYITRCAHHPDYTYNPALFNDPESRASSQCLRIPPGPNNPVGTAWMGLSLPGYGIHGAPSPETIGQAESHGCIRLANWDASRLLPAVYPGLPVLILP